LIQNLDQDRRLSFQLVDGLADRRVLHQPRLVLEPPDFRDSGQDLGPNPLSRMSRSLSILSCSSTNQGASAWERAITGDGSARQRLLELTRDRLMWGTATPVLGNCVPGGK
jgi:hypothetical protein